MIVGQVLIRGFWNLANYCVVWRRKRKQRNFNLAAFDWSVLHWSIVFGLGARSFLLKGLLLHKGLLWPYLYYLSFTVWRFLVLGSSWEQDDTCTVVSLTRNSRMVLMANLLSRSRSCVLLQYFLNHKRRFFLKNINWILHWEGILVLINCHYFTGQEAEVRGA